MTSPDRSTCGCRGFSIVELVVVIGIILALLGTLITALALAGKRAQSTQTQFFMTSVSNALTAFQTDVGYLPPVLGRRLSEVPIVTPGNPNGNTRDLEGPPTWQIGANGQPTSAAKQNLQNWYSFTSLPEYLIGYGNRSQDGHGAFDPAPAGTPGAREPLAGFRHPGDDGVWGSLLNPRSGQPNLGSLNARNPLEITGGFTPATVNGAVLHGKVFGPYLQLNDSDSLGAIKSFDSNGNPVVARPGEDPNFDAMPKVFLDYWGSPITYYRRAYPLADLKGREPALLTSGGSNRARDLGDIFALRPFEFKPGEDLVGIEDDNNDGSTLGRLKTASYAIFSRGPDKAWDRMHRRDADDFNADNIVEVGQ
ncbi:MAG: type II secretion system protein [Phycisphaerae bacterium]|nr:type II secretion system protein [Phycisphaerae bacterium]